MRSNAVAITLVLVAASGLPAQTIENFAFELPKLGGGTLRASDFKENVLIVDLWGTWCPPCRDAVPHLQRLYAKYKHYGLEIVGANYEQGPRAKQLELARSFAAEKGIAYHLVMGDPNLQRQVPNFRGYPTMLMFGRNLQFAKLHVGFEAGDEKEIERWVRAELGLPAAASDAKEAHKDEGDEEVEIEEDAAESPTRSNVPAGAIFKPGDGDKGFEFEAQDVDGKAFKFSELRGKPVILALTTTWDPEAANTAALLQKLHTAAGDKAHVLAASFERASDEAAKVVAIREFLTRQQATYRAFPAGIGFNKKIHLFSGVPLFLAFDAEGTLVAREGGMDAELFDKLARFLQ